MPNRVGQGSECNVGVARYQVGDGPFDQRASVSQIDGMRRQKFLVPFGRLLAAHAQVRGWKLATGDGALFAQLGAHHGLSL